jgi:hypothetical protein
MEAAYFLQQLCQSRSGMHLISIITWILYFENENKAKIELTVES